jgi:hypothetical protein
MTVRFTACVVLWSFALVACDASSSNSCSSREELAQLAAALGDDLQSAEASGKIDRTKAAEAMGRMLTAGQTFETKRDRRAYCAALDKIRKDSGL